MAALRDLPLCFVIFSVLFHGIKTQSGVKCDSKQTELVAKFQPQTFVSYGYPDSYPQDDTCMWTIKAAVSKKDYTIQIYASEFDLSEANEDCSAGYMEIFEGPDIGSIQSVEKWCSAQPQVFLASHEIVMLRFVSLAKTPGQGFSINYSLIGKPNLVCDGSGQGAVNVGAFPLVAPFQGNKDPGTCEWKISSDRDDAKLVVELVVPSDIPCDLGHFIFFEGGQTDSHLNYEYCATSQSFTKMYLASNELVLRWVGKSSFDSSPLVLKIERRTAEGSDCDALVEVPETPVFLSMPFFKKGPSDESCPVKIRSTVDGMPLRVDILSSDQNLATCDTELVAVTDSDGTTLGSSCNRGRNPVVFTRSHEATVAQTSAFPVFIRVVALAPECSGHPGEEMLSVKDLSLLLTLPETGHYSNLARCEHGLKTESPDSVLYLKINWTVPREELAYDVSSDGKCDGDFLNIYDGQNAKAPLLFSSCAGAGGMRQNVETTVVSSQDHMYVVLDADDKIPGHSAKLMYHSNTAAGASCGGKRMIKVGRRAQVITSPNFPNPVPVNQRCLYDLVSDNKDEMIVVKVVDSNLSERCETMLMIYQGRYQVGRESRSADQVCGKQSGVFRVEGQSASLLSVSEEQMGPGGWKVEVYTEPAGTTGAGGSRDKDGNSATSHIGSLILTLFMLICVCLL